MKELNKPTYSLAMQEEDRDYVIKKLGLTDDTFKEIMDAPKKSYWDYPSYGHMMKTPLFQLFYNSALRSVRMYRSLRDR